MNKLSNNLDSTPYIYVIHTISRYSGQDEQDLAITFEHKEEVDGHDLNLRRKRGEVFIFSGVEYLIDSLEVDDMGMTIHLKDVRNIRQEHSNA